MKYINYSKIEEEYGSLWGWSHSAVILLLARTAKATDATKHTIDDLYETQDELNSTKGQEDGEQRDIPYYYVVGF